MYPELDAKIPFPQKRDPRFPITLIHSSFQSLHQLDYFCLQFLIQTNRPENPDFSIFFLILALGGHSENFIYFQF